MGKIERVAMLDEHTQLVKIKDLGKKVRCLLRDPKGPRNTHSNPSLLAQQRAHTTEFEEEDIIGSQPRRNNHCDKHALEELTMIYDEKHNAQNLPKVTTGRRKRRYTIGSKQIMFRLSIHPSQDQTQKRATHQLSLLPCELTVFISLGKCPPPSAFSSSRSRVAGHVEVS